MERPELLAFLEAVGAGSLESYLSQHGDDPFAGLEERLQWAAWNFRDPENAREANFLMQHHDSLREVLDEGETAWHLRIKREERAAKSPKPPGNGGPPVPPPGMGTVQPNPGRTVASVTPAPMRTSGPTATPAPAPISSGPPMTPPPAPQRPPPAPSFSQLEPAAKPPPLSEQATEIRVSDKPDFDGEPTISTPKRRRSSPAKRRGGEAFKPKSRPGELSNLLEIPIDTEDVPMHHRRSGLGLGIEKTGYGESEPAPPPRRRSSHSRPADDHDMVAPPAANGNMSFLMLGIGLAVAGMGALALAGAIVFGVMQNGGTPAATPPPPPSMQDVMPADPTP